MRGNTTTFQVWRWTGPGVPPDIREVAKHLPLPSLDDLQVLQVFGWVGARDLTDRYDAEDGCWGRLGGVPWIQMVVVHKKAPDSLVKARVADLVRLDRAAYAGKAARKALAKRVREELDAVAQPALRGIDVLQPEPGLVVVCSSSDSVNNGVFAAFARILGDEARGWKYCPMATGPVLREAVQLASLDLLRGKTIELDELKVMAACEPRDKELDLSMGP